MFFCLWKILHENNSFSEEEIKIDWDISVIFTPLCEIKFDGKIRAMDIFMDTNLICKVINKKIFF
jgi:hypothetical protein